ncbi:DinB family protein [Chitinophaga horti]|uniref:DinB family protein n=1 Tax=Chitinophaga horti TaxID=2920382 RepID=A0ABY6J428_9BACT|nr:DinB family protein [Chitinophaga horti]UYQ93382.1 DinB family protein [Chitinophaga horti]
MMQLQYDMVKGSRQVLLDYCATLSDAHFLQPCEGFGRGGSIRNLLVHICNTYQGWIGQDALQQELPFTPYEQVQNIDDARQLFAEINLLLADFFARYPDPQARIGDSTALELFTHVITHEFHHKGQILSISRHWGHIPVDTDIKR